MKRMIVQGGAIIDMLASLFDKLFELATDKEENVEKEIKQGKMSGETLTGTKYTMEVYSTDDTLIPKGQQSEDENKVSGVIDVSVLLIPGSEKIVVLIEPSDEFDSSKVRMVTSDPIDKGQVKKFVEEWLKKSGNLVLNEDEIVTETSSDARESFKGASTQVKACTRFTVYPKHK